ncbi:MAG: HU-CCDC81 and SPOR domain-containing protein [Bacteroidia bacterium]|nr:HU-CCDC81 and SPOR domain-containing protein [Bacteroidia bacterium]
MDIVGYIRKLLFEHECVILPGFGGFISNYKHAEINETQYSFIPPSKEISFNRALINNDGLLINRIAATEGLSYSQAKIELENFINGINVRLKQGNEVNFEDIGTFVFDRQQLLIFEPCLAENFLLESFGLSSFQFPAIEEADIRRDLERRFKAKEKIRPVSLSYKIRVAAIGIIAVIIFSLVPSRTVIDEQKTSIYPDKPVISEKILRPEDILNNPESVNEAIDKMTIPRIAMYYSEDKSLNVSSRMSVMKHLEDTIVQQKTEIAEAQSSKIEKTEEQHAKYFIIAGSFTVRRQAQVFSKQLARKGFAPEILDRQNGNYRISIGAFAEKSDASEELTRLRAQNVSCWILTRT